VGYRDDEWDYPDFFIPPQPGAGDLLDIMQTLYRLGGRDSAFDAALYRLIANPFFIPIQGRPCEY
jgi:hypothetical protein